MYQDQLGSVIGTANSAGTSTAIHSYGPYGEPNIATGIRFRYTGQQFLGSLNLYYYKARFYSPALGRFLQTDPIGTADDLNLYAYVGNNPINFNDPSGEFANFLLGGAANVAIGYGISWATGQDYSWGNAVVDFGIGAATSGLAALNAARQGTQIVEGIYVASQGVKTGLPYVGQSGNIATRLEQHIAKGKITEEVAGNAKVYEVLGGKTSREVAEQRMINQKGGIASLENVVNPVGPARSSLMGNGILGQITKSNEMNWGAVLGADFAYQLSTSSNPAYGGSGSIGGK
ncbi:RHS repeat-associated core domain-containing protein [Nitrosomonas europaea]|uniref:RHS repeat-associated core domain-containing protein n=1 Tax=Nitrosomonas europaea TaxID=915 RepID=UPI002D7E96BF|nr:RHS repeat-associated core domain-containing protein [Nitrosomonas europaea]